ncbi:MAG TPA: hypothetical protein VMD77_04015 [Candidatus Baltobacteraceae bacterium]|jgi:hypothetical protein|nr:hypothetical protein [Candidatus Baltobacteraceae bacterium]
MAEEMETILRKSLDAVNRSQRWQMAGLLFFLLFLVLHLLTFIGAVHAGHEIQPVTARTVAMGIFSVLLMVVACAFGITFFISRMTKRILKAIELSSKP